MRRLKPGFLTSEFWVTTATQVVSLSVLSGLIEPKDVSDITEAAITVVTSLMSLLTALAYIRGRIALKEKAPKLVDNTYT